MSKYIQDPTIFTIKANCTVFFFLQNYPNAVYVVGIVDSDVYSFS